MSDDFLLDTSFLSALSPGRKELPPSVADWLGEVQARFHLSSIAVAEVWAGIERLRRLQAMRRAEAYERWLLDTVAIVGERVLSFDLGIAAEAGRLSDRATAMGRHPGFADVAIAATASVHGLVVLTRNLKHFAPLGVRCIDPLEGLPND